LIDVLLVLLIIFMVITPSKPSRFEAKVPAEPKEEEKNVILKPNPNTLIVFVSKDGGKIRLNQDDIGDISDTAPLTGKLQEVFKYRETNGILRENSNEVEKTVFVKAPKSVKYGDVVKAIDAAKLAGAQPIGLQIDDLEN
jgi:biopolymer transport protein ExbD